MSKDKSNTEQRRPKEDRPKGVIRICKAHGCHNAATADGFCRLCYLRNWKKTHSRKAKKTGRREKKNLEMRQYNNEECLEFFTGEGYDEDIERLIEKIKIEDGF